MSACINSQYIGEGNIVRSSGNDLRSRGNPPQCQSLVRAAEQITQLTAPQRGCCTEVFLGGGGSLAQSLCRARRHLRMALRLPLSAFPYRIRQNAGPSIEIAPINIGELSIRRSGERGHKKGSRVSSAGPSPNNAVEPEPRPIPDLLSPCPSCGRGQLNLGVSRQNHAQDSARATSIDDHNPRTDLLPAIREAFHPTSSETCLAVRTSLNVKPAASLSFAFIAMKTGGNRPASLPARTCKVACWRSDSRSISFSRGVGQHISFDYKASRPKQIAKLTAAQRRGGWNRIRLKAAAT